MSEAILRSVGLHQVYRGNREGGIAEKGISRAVVAVHK